MKEIDFTIIPYTMSSAAATLQNGVESFVAIDAASLITGIVVGNLFVNTFVAVTLYYLADVVNATKSHKDSPPSSTITKTLYGHYLFLIAVGFASGAAMRSSIVCQYWLVGHVFCVATVILNNAVVDLTYAALSELSHLRRQHPWLMNAVRVTRGFIIALWMTTLLYCILVLDRYDGVTTQVEDMTDTREVIVFLPPVLVNSLFVWMYIKSRSVHARYIRMEDGMAQYVKDVEY